MSLKNNLDLYLIYNYSLVSAPTYGPLDSELKSSYYIIDFFSDVGEVGREVLCQHFESAYGYSPQMEEKFGPFKSVEELTDFAMLVCKDLLSPSVYILSTFDFNRAVGSLNHINEIKNALQENSKKLVNTNISNPKSSFIRRIFLDA